MTITVVGHVTRDTLIFPDAGWRILESLGGTLYTVSALASLTTETVRLVCNVGEDTYDSVIAQLDRIPNVDTSHIKKVKGSHFHCYILFASEYGTQYDEGMETSISFSQIEDGLEDSSFVLVSPMTGFDLTLSTMRRISRTAHCPVYFDYHMLSLDRDRLGNRFLKRRKNWVNWCSSCSHLQMNRFEAESLSGSEMKSEADLMSFAKPLMRGGVKSVAVTLGSEGALVCWNVPDFGMTAMKIPSSDVPVVDPTGCGDVFAASFIIRFLQTGNYLESYKFANTVAGQKCGLSGLDGLSQILHLNQSA